MVMPIATSAHLLQSGVHTNTSSLTRRSRGASAAAARAMSWTVKRKLWKHGPVNVMGLSLDSGPFSYPELPTNDHHILVRTRPVNYDAAFSQIILRWVDRFGWDLGHTQRTS